MELGIDIGARQHEVMLLDGGSEDGFSITNDARGNKALLKAIGGRPCRAVLEATGAYYLDTAIALFDAGVEVMVINPRHGKHFAKALGWHSSTDRISARMLAEFAQRMPFKAWTPPPGTWMEFRGISRQINRLTKLLAASKNRLHAHQATAQSSRVILDDERYGIELYEQRIARLTAAAMQLIELDPLHRDLFRRFPGCGNQTHRDRALHPIDLEHVASLTPINDGGRFVFPGLINVRPVGVRVFGDMRIR